MKKDIQTEEDVSLLIETFYNAIRNSPNLSHFFKDISWDEHLPKMKRFWCFVLLDKPGYVTNVPEKHRNLSLQINHFDEWLLLFNKTMDKHFFGEKAQLGKDRAKLVGLGIQQKMGLLKNQLD